MACEISYLAGMDITEPTQLQKDFGSLSPAASSEPVTAEAEIRSINDNYFVFVPSMAADQALKNYYAEHKRPATSLSHGIAILLHVPLPPGTVVDRFISVRQDQTVALSWRRLWAKYNNDMITGIAKTTMKERNEKLGLNIIQSEKPPGRPQSVRHFTYEEFMNGIYDLPVMPRNAGVKMFVAGSTRTIRDWQHVVDEGGIENIPPGTILMNFIFDARATLAEQNKSEAEINETVPDDSERVFDAHEIEAWIKKFEAKHKKKDSQKILEMFRKADTRLGPVTCGELRLAFQQDGRILNGDDYLPEDERGLGHSGVGDFYERLLEKRENPADFPSPQKDTRTEKPSPRPDGLA